MAHEGDRIDFEPGGRVAIGFRPRAGDGWPIDGRAPRPLPAGRATGRAMAASAQGSRWATVRGSTSPTPRRAGRGRSPRPPTTPRRRGGDRPPTGRHAASPTSPPTDSGVDLAAASGLRRQVFGFLPYWELNGASTRLNHDVLSTIAYFSVGATGNGDLKKKDRDGSSTTGWGGWTSSNMTKVISGAHQHGTRVVLTISVFAWTTAQANTQRAILGSAAARRNLARQAAAAVRDRGADGVNLDFEPLASGYSDEFVALLKTVRSELNRVRKGYQLTYDTMGFIGNYPLEASVGAGAADAIFVMGYDYRTSGSGTAGSIDPLSGPSYDLADTVRAYTARVSPSRIILGPAVVRPRVVDRRRRGAVEDAQRRQVRLQRRRQLRERGGPRRQARAAVGRARAQPLRRVPPPELHLGLRLRDELAAGLLRRRGVAQAALRAGQRLRAPRRGDVGAGLRRRPLGAQPVARRDPSSSTSPRRRPGSGSSPRPRSTRGSWSPGRPATPARSPRTTSRSRSTAARGRRG